MRECSRVAEETLRQRLGELTRERRSRARETAADERPPQADGGPRSAPFMAATSEAVGVEAFLPGGEWHGPEGSVFVHECLRSQVERRLGAWDRLDWAPPRERELTALIGAGLEHALFLDLETCGLASSTVFLAGTMHWNGTDFVLRQYFARHYGEEAALLEGVGELAREYEFLVTFNGKSYDVPFLHNRAVVHGVPLRLPVCHLDILHPSRRRWRSELSDCRLQTLERLICRRRRSGDVPSDEG